MKPGHAQKRSVKRTKFLADLRTITAVTIDMEESINSKDDIEVVITKKQVLRWIKNLKSIDMTNLSRGMKDARIPAKSN